MAAGSPQKLKMNETLQQYDAIQNKIMQIDPTYYESVKSNPFIQCLKTGIIQKKSDGRFGKWENRFLALTNVCLLYFKKGEEQPRKFKTLNNFKLVSLTEQEEKQQGRQFVIKIEFNKKLVAKNNFIACKDAADKQSWMDAFKDYQINTLQKRMELFE